MQLSNLISSRLPTLASTTLPLAILPGEGIGPEIIVACHPIFAAIEKYTPYTFDIEYGGTIGKAAYDECGSALTEDVAAFCRAIPFAYSALTHGGVVHLLHVLTPKEVPQASGKDEEAQAVRQQIANHRRKSLRQLRALIPKDAEQRGIATEVEVVDGRKAAEAICQSAERDGVDMICLSSHGRSGLVKLVAGSVTQAVLELTHRPVLLIRSARE